MKSADKTELYSGVFWIIDPDSMGSSREYCFLIPTSPEGKVESDDSLNAKSGITYNHEKLWNSLPRSMTRGKEIRSFSKGQGPDQKRRGQSILQSVAGQRGFQKIYHRPV